MSSTHGSQPVNQNSITNTFPRRAAELSLMLSSATASKTGGSVLVAAAEFGGRAVWPFTAMIAASTTTLLNRHSTIFTVASIPPAFRFNAGTLGNVPILHSFLDRESAVLCRVYVCS